MEKIINILLVEDDSLDATDIRRSLDKMGIFYKLHWSKNGEEALGFLSDVSYNEKPDVVLLDINMPKMNGLEFLRHVRSQEVGKDLKVFMLTTSEQRVDKNSAQQLGADGYIVKPLKLNTP